MRDEASVVLQANEVPRREQPRLVALAHGPSFARTRTSQNFRVLHEILLLVSQRRSTTGDNTIAMAPKKSSKTSDSINAKLALTIKVRNHWSRAK